MRYLVTGAAGFIGSFVAQKLISLGNSVVTIDNLSTGKAANIPKGCEFIEGDTFDKEIIRKLDNERFDAIIHIAGQSSGEVSFEDPEYDINTNTLSTLFLLQYAQRTRCEKFIYASSMSVYGDANPDLVDESTLPVPKSFYAVGKLASENYLRIFSTFGIKCTALRFFNVFGIGQNMDNLKQGMASIYLAQAVNNGHIIIKGDGERFRDFVYIDDVVNSVLVALNRTGEQFEIFNVSNERKIYVKDIIRIIEEAIPGTTHEYVHGTPGDQRGIYGKNDKINNMGWKSNISFEDGMKMMIEWAKKK